MDCLLDAAKAAGLKRFLHRGVDREAKAANSDKIRAFCLHGGVGRALMHAGYFQVKSTMEFTAKINAVEVPASFYQDTSGWHVTLGDSDQDR
jgi:hypothetical protein